MPCAYSVAGIESRGYNASVRSGCRQSEAAAAFSQGSCIPALTIRSDSETKYGPLLEDAVSENPVLGSSWSAGIIEARRKQHHREKGKKNLRRPTKVQGKVQGRGKACHRIGMKRRC